MGSAIYDGLPLGCAEVAPDSVLYPFLLPTEGFGADRINQLGMQRPARAALHAFNEWLLGNPLLCGTMTPWRRTAPHCGVDRMAGKSSFSPTILQIASSMSCRAEARATE